MSEGGEGRGGGGVGAAHPPRMVTASSPCCAGGGGSWPCPEQGREGGAQLLRTRCDLEGTSW